MCLSPRFQPVPAHLLHVGRTITTVWGMKILMIEREQRGMSECSAMLLLQWYYNGNSTFLTKPLPYFLSEPMWPNHHSGWLSAQTQRDKTIHQGGTVPQESSLVFLWVLGAEGATVSHRWSPHQGPERDSQRLIWQTETGTCSCRQMLKIPSSCSLDKS